ncbi:hypothetical protein [Rhizobium leguminosarum]|uniref:hypothetical protein n=1 Tax=Rhizobium leguminosarum TaxID=384 RepID=UPI003D6E5748
MNEISIGAVGAAAIAGLVSLLGLIIGKEQKVSEFRQAWIDELRKSFVAYLVNINAIGDALRLKKAGQPIDTSAFIAIYKSLNEASHGITLRVNATEAAAKALMKSMSEFETLAENNASLTPEKLRDAEKAFVGAATELLKFEWNRVKRGEEIFVVTKRIVCVVIVATLMFLAYAWATREKTDDDKESSRPTLQLVQMQRSGWMM